MEVLTATTPEDTLRQPDAVSLRDICGEVFWLEGVAGLLPSTIEESSGKYYAIYHCRWENGTKFTSSSGSPYVFFRAAHLDEMGWLPRRVTSMLLQSKNNPQRYSLWIVDRPLREEGPIVEVVEAETVGVGA